MRYEVCSDGDDGEKQTQQGEPHHVLVQKHLHLSFLPKSIVASLSTLNIPPWLFRFVKWSNDPVMIRLLFFLAKQQARRRPTMHTRNSMTSLLTHRVSHNLPGLPLGPKLITSPLKMFIKCYRQLSKSCQKWQTSDLHKQLSMSKIIQIFLEFFFIEEYDFRGTLFVIDIFWKFLNQPIF